MIGPRAAGAVVVAGAIGLLALPAVPAVAQSSRDTLRRIVEQDTIRVRASRFALPLRDLATTATVIPRDRIRQAGARALAGVMADVPGIHVYDLTGNDTQSQVESRGFASLGFTSHVRVLLDGVPVNDIEGERVDWNLLAPPQVERIELLRGPASYLYGDAAMAGVIDIVTRDQAPGSRAWAGGSGGSFGEGIGQGGGMWRNAVTAASGSFAERHLEGWREHGAATVASGMAAGERTIGAWRARAQLLLDRSDVEQPGALPEPLWRTDGHRSSVLVPGPAGESTMVVSPDEARTHAAQGAVVLHGPLAGADLTATVSADARERNARETIVPAGTLDHLSNAHRQRGELRAQWSGPFGADWVLGGDSEQGRLLTSYFPPGPEAGRSSVGDARVTRRSAGAYLLGRRTLPRRFALTAALRGDWLRSEVSGLAGAHTTRAVSPAATLNYTTPRGGNAFVSVGGSFKSPTLEQLYDPRPFFVPAPVTISSTTLAPQRGWNVDLGMRALPAPRARAEATFYYGRSRDEIGFDLADFRYSNIARSIHYGFEGSLSAPLAHGFTARASYAYTRAVFDGGPDDGNQINGVPEHQLALGLALAHGMGGDAAVEVRYLDRQWADEANTVALPAYAVTDLSVRQPIGGVALAFAVRNALDRRYAPAGFVTTDLVGRPLPLYYPGAARAVRIGLEWPAHDR